ncbi:MAG: sulfite oxidase-like oxidoreductase [Devosia nanyangense]|nr:sulfite oxidase-like oxidoreductase [Devosia nanyangense]
MADDTKLTRTKQLWAQSGKFLTGHTSRPETERLPPGQHLVNNWPVLDLGQTPNVPRERWRLDVGGVVDNPFSWDWATFAAQPQVEKTTDIHCVTTWSRYDNRWEGTSTHHLIEMAQPRSEATFVLFTSNDGYTTNMALSDFASPDAMLVHSWQGEPLTLEHGGPVRVVVPHLYFWKSAKWIRRIDFASEDQLGFWEVRGYHNHADPWLEERYS